MNNHLHYKKEIEKMQEIKIAEEMKDDAVKLINSVEVFKSKYGLNMVDVQAFTWEKILTIYGDDDENDGFDSCDIYADGTIKISHIKSTRK
jgi:hypothetical protein